MQDDIGTLGNIFSYSFFIGKKYSS